MSDVRNEFDLQPDPRILPMLGEINLVQWKCLAELIDNAVDGFLSAKRRGIDVENPEISVAVPTNSDSQAARVTVRDNGPGMSRETLEKAVRAGWSGNDPVSNLGLFGMGFNIATARLGTVTTVWTARKDASKWTGLRIDFDELRRQRHFRAPELSRTKADPEEHGTEVTIERLKPGQQQWFAKAARRTELRRELSRAYAAMLRAGGQPIAFSLTLNGTSVKGRQHCLWGDDSNEPRTVDTTRFGKIDALQHIDLQLADRPFCRSCWQWLPPGEAACPYCSNEGDVVLRSRAVRGWVGVQRYLSKSEYGIDLVRHGRKIEIASKELFEWRDGDIIESEYPIDDPRQRGRLVGEIHIDHCRVSYTKDRFDRTDPAWEDMVRVVRGEGPLRPDKASEAGFGQNTAPLFLLFQAFRRSTPKSKTAGVYKRLLVVPNNERAEEMAKKFHERDPEYQSDLKWWELVEEADIALLGSKGSRVTAGGSAVGGGSSIDDTLEGFGPESPGDGGASVKEGASPSTVPEVELPIASLSAEYRSDSTGQRWDVKALEIEAGHTALGGADCPWAMRARPTGTHEFLVNLRHPIFESATLTPLDGLLAELAWSAMDFVRDQSGPATFSSVLAELRSKYATAYALDLGVLSNEARQIFQEIAGSLRRNVDATDAAALFGSMSSQAKDVVLQGMAARAVTDPQGVIGSGRFLEYAGPRDVCEFVEEHPELFFDGRCWEEPFSNLDYGSASVTELAQRRVLRQYGALMSEAAWLSEQDVADVSSLNNSKVMRARLALELLSDFSESEG